MLFNYQVIDKSGQPANGSIDAVNMDTAINSLQRRGFVVSSIKPAADNALLSKNISFFERIKSKDIVLLSRAMSTLFGAQVSALRVFRLLATETMNPTLRQHLIDVAEDLQGGSSISGAMSRHPKVFSEFYVNMVRSGEESGRLEETFTYLADNLERNYALVSKAKNALVYPIFVIATFVGVMVLMLVSVIPKLSSILSEAGRDIPIYTKVVIAISDFLVGYGILLVFGLVIGGFFMWRWGQTPVGKDFWAKVKVDVPYFGNLYRKYYLARISENMNTMLLSAIPILKAFEVTAKIVEGSVYEKALLGALESIKAGSSVSDSLARHKEFPGMMVAMMRVGEEGGEMEKILKTLARFYEREVSEAVDTLVGMIEPVLIVALGLGVGFLLASVLIPIYNISSSV